jgi:DinB superfamily
MVGRPQRDEAAEYYFKYIDRVPDADICAVLEKQETEALTLFGGISEERSLYRYAPEKWTIRETLGHVNDTERLFVARAFWFARGLESELPSFDQNVAIAAAGANDRSWASHVDEFQTVRAATLTFFSNLPAAAWTRRGVASGNPFSVRALAFLAAGHVEHHNAILRERYLRQ